MAQTMNVWIDLHGVRYAVDLSCPIDISIPMIFDGPQPLAYGASAATASTLEQDGWIGDTRRGGPCNVQTLTLTPHCNGTHTECVGHLTRERMAISSVLHATLCPGTLITIEPRRRTDTAERYHPGIAPEDWLITKAALDEAGSRWDAKFSQSLIVRTRPNDDTKRSRTYGDFPFFTVEAMEWVRARGCEHLIVDTPSVDRARDEGLLTAHRIFWDAGNHPPSQRTITEMAYVPNEIEDGQYFVMIQIPNFVTDAAPSRVFLFRAEAG